jgi:predicted deacylase
MSANPAAPLACSIDLTAPGKRLGHLELGWSDNVHAYGVIPVPIAVIANGTGPTVLISAGVHGDEYEGLVIVRRLLRDLHPDGITGRVLLLPAANLPAVRAATRVSPIDGQNMNRAFPGQPATGPTALIADFIERALLPTVDYAVDLHSGGTRSFYAPCGYVYAAGDQDFRRRKLAAMHAFGAPLTTVVAATSSGGSLSAACERHGVVMIATELGGGGVLDRRALAIGEDGTMALLIHAGVLAGDMSGRRTALHHVESRASAVMATIDGMLEHAGEPGDAVTAGDVAGWIWPLDDPGREPVALHYRTGGVILARRATPLVLAGDTVCHVGKPITDAEFMTIGSPARP